MSKTTAQIHQQQLFCPGVPGPVCRLDSPAWFLWLETAYTFRYFSDHRQNSFRGYGPLYAPVSLRQERRRQSWHWYAYRRVYRILHKRHVGKSATLTIARLEEMVTRLHEVS